MGKSQIRYLIVIGILLITAFISSSLFRSQPRDYEIRLDELPLTIGSWQGKDLKLDNLDLVYAVLETKAVLSRLYTNSQIKESSIDFFVTYAEKTSRGFHPPEVSFVASGKTIIKSGIEYISLSDGENASELETNMFLGKTPRGKILFLYWFGIGDRLMANYYKSSVYLLWDTMRGKNSPATMVRIAMPLIDGDFEKTMDAATDFIRKIVPILPEYLNERKES